MHPFVRRNRAPLGQLDIRTDGLYLRVPQDGHRKDNSSFHIGVSRGLRMASRKACPRLAPAAFNFEPAVTAMANGWGWLCWPAIPFHPNRPYFAPARTLRPPLSIMEPQIAGHDNGMSRNEGEQLESSFNLSDQR
jgi:hypothetical protein